MPLPLLAAMMLAGPAALPDYADPDLWICRPDRNDVCSGDLATRTVGKTELGPIDEPDRPEDPAADCFYVYPTVSGDRGGNSDLVPGENEELLVTYAQFARFSTACRTFAPLYRQYTTGAIRNRMLFGRMGGDRDLAYGDVREAFATYLANDNDGRPFVLVGHSQGAQHLRRLLAEEIEGTPLQDRMLSAMLIGTNVASASGTTPGAFENVPPCETRGQTGCVISYVSFPEDAPPPDDGIFGARDEEGRLPICTNPANLGSDDDADLASVFTTATSAYGVKRDWMKGAEVDMPFVETPGLVSGACTETDGTRYLSITVHGDPDDPRTDEIGGLLKVGPVTFGDWGLHLIDMNLTQGDLLELVSRQTEAFTRRGAE